MKRTHYFIPFLFICCWWYLAFFANDTSSSLSKQTVKESPKTLNLPEYIGYLSPFSRDEIKQGLDGNSAVMVKLMKEWDIDAQILESQGLSEIRRLRKSAFIRAQIIGKKLNSQARPALENLERQVQKSVVFDDQGIPFTVSPSSQTFLPQTFTAASFLFALVPARQIIAIPRGIRAQTNLYPKDLTDQITLNTDRTYSEHLYQIKPSIAFAADYSKPSALEALKNQSIPIFTLSAMKTVDQVTDAIVRIGNVANRSLEAEVLSLFIESAMLAIDNRLIALHHEIIKQHKKDPSVMFLNHCAHYSAPTDRTIAGDLLHRLNHLQFHVLPKLETHASNWSLFIDQEQIVNADPDCLIIAAKEGARHRMQMENDPAFASISARVNQRIHTVDFATQAPTQYIVLAYYDIAQALTQF